MRDALRLYGRYAALSLRSQMQYRVSFLLETLGHLLVCGMEFFAIWALFDRFGSLRGWRLEEVALLYGMIHTSFGIAEGAARGFDVFPAYIRSGEFDRMLLRPRSTHLQVMGQELQLMRAGRLLQSLLVLAWAIPRLGIAGDPAGALLLAASIAGGACLFTGLLVLQATMAFWTVQGLEVMNTLTYGGVETAQFPLPIYRPWFRAFFTLVVPLACANYLPAQPLLGRPDPAGSPVLLQWLAPLVCVAFLLLSLRVWGLGVRHYRSTGS